MKLADVCLRLGEHVPAKRYLVEALRHCRAFDDVDTEWELCIVQAWVTFLEGDAKQVRGGVCVGKGGGWRVAHPVGATPACARKDPSHCRAPPPSRQSPPRSQHDPPNPCRPPRGPRPTHHAPLLLPFPHSCHVSLTTPNRSATLCLPHPLPLQPPCHSPLTYPSATPSVPPQAVHTLLKAQAQAGSGNGHLWRRTMTAAAHFLVSAGRTEDAKTLVAQALAGTALPGEARRGGAAHGRMCACGITF